MTHITRTGPSDIGKRRGSSGDVAGRVFELLEHGTPLDEIVVELGVSPDVVENLLRTWARLRGLIPLTAEGSHALSDLLYRTNAFANGAELVTALRHFAANVRLVCGQCGQGSADYCLACPAREARKASERKRKRGRQHEGEPDDDEPKQGDQTPGLFSAELGAAILRATTPRE